MPLSLAALAVNQLTFKVLFLDYFLYFNVVSYKESTLFIFCATSTYSITCLLIVCLEHKTHFT